MSTSARWPSIALSTLVVLLAAALAVTALQLRSARAERAAAPPAPGRFQGVNVFAETLVAMSWPEVEAEAERGAVVLLPQGVIEEHGPHMSLGADLYQAYDVCRRARVALERRGVPAVIAPPSWIGINVATGAFPGSMDAAEETISAVLRDELGSLRRWGFRRVAVVNLHGDGSHRRALAQAVGAAAAELGIDATLLQPGIPLPRPPGLSPTQPDSHAGAYETGTMVALFPGEVDVALARSLPPESAFAPRGYVGDPAHFSTAGVVEAQEAAGRAVADALAGAGR